MNEMTTYVIEGVLRTTSPLHITDTDKSLRWDAGKRQFVYNGKGGFPLTLTRSARLMVGLKTEEGADGEDSEMTYKRKFPIIPASTWRGMLRRGAARVIEDHVIHNLNTKLTYEAYQGLHCGAVSGKPDGVASTTEEIVSARSHVFYGIFGGGPRMLPGALKMSDSIPITEELVGSVLPQSLFDESLKGVKPQDLFEVSPVIRKDDFYSATGDTNAAEVVGDYEAKFAEERQKDIERAIKKASGKNAGEGGEDGEEDGERGVRAMSFRQDVAVGVPFRFRMTIKGNESQVGMLIAALDNRLPDGIGGRSALGYGNVSGTIYVTGSDGKRLPVLGVEDGGVTIMDGAELYMNAMSEAVNALTLEDITRYMTPDSKVKEAKGKAKKEA